MSTSVSLECIVIPITLLSAVPVITPKVIVRQYCVILLRGMTQHNLLGIGGELRCQHELVSKIR